MQRYSSDEVSSALERFEALLRTPMELSAMLQSMSTQILDTIPAADMAGVTLLSAADKKPMTVACTDARTLDVSTSTGTGQMRGPVWRRHGHIRYYTYGTRTLDCGGLGSHAMGERACQLSVRSAGHRRRSGRSVEPARYNHHGFSAIDQVLFRYSAAVESAIWNAPCGATARRGCGTAGSDEDACAD